MTDKQQPFKMPEPAIDDLMRQAGLEAIGDKDFRAARGRPMTKPEQDRYDAAVYFAELVWAAALRSPADQGEKDRKDAERYRWLRDDNISLPDGMRALNVVQARLPFTDGPDEDLFGHRLDEAVDAAIESTKGGT